jgi:hypothetical protein
MGWAIEPRKDYIAEAEAVDTAEGDMCGAGIARRRRSAVVEDPITHERSASDLRGLGPGGFGCAGPRREGDELEPATNGREKSDPAIGERIKDQPIRRLLPSGAYPNRDTFMLEAGAIAMGWTGAPGDRQEVGGESPLR